MVFTYKYMKCVYVRLVNGCADTTQKRTFASFPGPEDETTQRDCTATSPNTNTCNLISYFGIGAVYFPGRTCEDSFPLLRIQRFRVTIWFG